MEEEELKRCELSEDDEEERKKQREGRKRGKDAERGKGEKMECHT